MITKPNVRMYARTYVTGGDRTRAHRHSVYRMRTRLRMHAANTTRVPRTPATSEQIAKRSRFRNASRVEKRKSRKGEIPRRRRSSFACRRVCEWHKVDRTEITICMSAYRLHPCQQDVLGDPIGRRRWHRCALYRGHKIPCSLLH